MSNPTKILLSLVLVLIIIIGAIWWLVASQSNNQSEVPVLAPDQGVQAVPQDQTQNPGTQPTNNQTPASGSTGTAPATSLSTGNTNDDISKDLTNVDSQMNNLNSDVTNSNPTLTPVTAQ